MGIKEVKQELIKKDKNELVKFVLELYKKYKNVKEYFEFYVSPNVEDLLKFYKEKVRKAFYPDRGDRLQLSIARKALNDFKKWKHQKKCLGI